VPLPFAPVLLVVDALDLYRGIWGQLQRSLLALFYSGDSDRDQLAAEARGWHVPRWFGLLQGRGCTLARLGQAQWDIRLLWKITGVVVLNIQK
jgi:hypothetical protein